MEITIIGTTFATTTRGQKFGDPGQNTKPFFLRNISGRTCVYSAYAWQHPRVHHDHVSRRHYRLLLSVSPSPSIQVDEDAVLVTYLAVMAAKMTAYLGRRFFCICRHDNLILQSRWVKRYAFSPSVLLS